MAKLRHRKGWYKGCYSDIHEKDWTLGETMKLKDLLDQWWNNVHVESPSGKKTHYCYKNSYTCDVAYELDGLPKSSLNKLVVVDKEWDEDADGYPVVGARFATKEEIEAEKGGQ